MFFSGKKKAAAAGQATTSATSLKESSPEHVDPLSVEVKRSAKDLRQQPMLPSPLSQSTKDLTFIEPPEKADKQQTSSAFSAEGSPQRRSFFGKKLSLSNSNRNSGEVPSSFFETFLGMVKVSSPLSGSGVVGPEDDVDAQGESPLSKSKASESYMVNTSLSSLETSIAGTPNGPTSPLAGYSNTIRRRKDKSKTSLAARASITSSALDHDNSSLFTSTLDQDNSREDESLDADDDSVFGISDQLKEIHLFVKSSRESSPYSCLPKAMISEVIRDLIKGVLVLETPDLPEEEKNPDNWRLCKIDRNMLATRVWLQNDASFDSYKINDGDELRLKLVTEKDAIKILPPQASVAITEAFSFEENVKDFIDRLLSKLGIKAGNQKYGLYYKKIGIWLDEKRTVNSYEIDPDHVIDLRIVTQEFLLRVNLPDAETKLTIKVLPSLTVFDVLGMLVYNLSVKRIALDGFRRGGEDVYTPPTSRTKPRISEFQVSSGRKLTKFGLYLPSKNIWLNESKVLEDYNLAKQPDEIHFKPQYHPITISLPQNMASKRSDLLRVHGSDGRISAQNSNLVQVFVSSTNKVKDITDLLNMDNPDYKDSPIAKEFSYGLFTRGNEKLRDEEVLWNLLKDISPLEIIDYRMLTRKITLTSSADLAVKVDVDVDFSKPVESIIPIFCRRFGVLRETEFKQVHLLGSNVSLDLSKSLLQLKISPESTLVFMVEYGQTPLAQKDDDANVWSEVDDSTSNIQYAAEGDKVVTAASLNKLIELLTSAEDGLESSAYLDFMKTFLLTYQSFTTPSAFLKKIIERYHVPRQMYKGSTFQEFEKMRTKVQLRCCNVLQQWTKKHFYDFVDFSGTLSSTQVNVNGNKSQLDQDRKKEQALNKHLLLIKVLDFAEKVIIEDHPLLGKQIRKNVLRLRDGSYISQAQMVRQSSVNTPTPKSPSKPITVGEDINLFALEPEELARQLTVMEFDLFAKLMVTLSFIGD